MKGLVEECSLFWQKLTDGNSEGCAIAYSIRYGKLVITHFHSKSRHTRLKPEECTFLALRILHSNGLYKVTVSPQSEVLGLSFYTYPSLKDERTTGRQFSESGIWDCKVRDTQSKELGAYEIWPAVPIIPLPWPPCLWLLMSWQNPWLPLVLDKSEKDSHPGFTSHFWQVWRGNWRMSVHNSRPLLSPPQYICLAIPSILGPTKKTSFIN